MREIRFRMWNLEEKKMQPVVGLGMMEIVPECGLVKSCYNEEYVFYENEFGDLVSVLLDKCILMQSTGLKDRNGKEIYEGDIVKTSLGDVGVVKFGICEDMEINDEYGFDYFGFYIDGIIDVFGLINKDVSTRVSSLVEGEVEVVGNIYENPDLLEQIKKDKQ